MFENSRKARIFEALIRNLIVKELQAANETKEACLAISGCIFGMYGDEIVDIRSSSRRDILRINAQTIEQFLSLKEAEVEPFLNSMGIEISTIFEGGAAGILSEPLGTDDTSEISGTSKAITDRPRRKQTSLHPHQWRDLHKIPAGEIDSEDWTRYFHTIEEIQEMSTKEECFVYSISSVPIIPYNAWSNIVKYAKYKYSKIDLKNYA